MNRIRKFFIPNLCISFTLVLVFVSLLNLIRGRDFNGFSQWILQFAALILLLGIADYLIEQINFKKWTIQLLLEFITNYALFLLGAYSLGWFQFQAENIISYTITYILVFALVYYRSYKQIKQDEEMINRILQNRNK